MGTYISLITLNVNGLNAPTKRRRLAEWMKKQDAYICFLQETYFRPRDTYRLKVRGWKKIFHANGNRKKAGVAILISDNIDFKDYYKGLPWWCSSWESTCQCRGHGLSPGLGRSHMPWSNWAHAPRLLSLCSGARGPRLLGPCAAATEVRVPRARAPRRERPLQWEAHALRWRVTPARRS